jgi:hypothetical protein
MQVFAAPAIGYMEVFVHGTSVSFPLSKGKPRKKSGAYDSAVMLDLPPSKKMGPAFNPPDWSTFFSAEAGASAALTGLIFVAISINLRRILRMQHLVARSAKALFLLTGILLASTVCMAPGQPIRVLGCELILFGALVWTLTTVAEHRASHKNPFVKTGVRIFQFVLAQLSTVPLIAGGVSLMLGFGGGLYWLMAGTIFSFVAALIDAWVLLIEILR